MTNSLYHIQLEPIGHCQPLELLSRYVPIARITVEFQIIVDISVTECAKFNALKILRILDSNIVINSQVGENIGVYGLLSQA